MSKDQHRDPPDWSQVSRRQRVFLCFHSRHSESEGLQLWWLMALGGSLLMLASPVHSNISPNDTWFSSGSSLSVNVHPKV